jgi:hypothetical protein
MSRGKGGARLRAAISALLVASSLGLVAPASRAGAPAGSPGRSERPATPVLIERARGRGAISGYKANLYLAYALAKPGRLPEAFRSDTPWRGTLPLLELRERIAKMPSGTRKEALRSTLEAQSAPTKCSNNNAPSNTTTSSHYLVHYPNSIGGGLDVQDYVDSLETAWTTEVTTFGWAAPPLHPNAGGKYHVIVTNLGSGLYGFVSPSGTYAGNVGNNPNTAWTEPDAYASCMALNSDYTGFASPPQASLDSTTGHEFNHSIQFGYGALTGTNRPDDVFIEGGATWMEDEVFDNANDNYHYLWPDFKQDMGNYTASPYPYWITFRGMTERYGTGSGGGGEQVMQDFWEEVSKQTTLGLNAMNKALQNRGTNLADAYHAYAIAVKFSKPCGGSYVLPYCFEEGAGYVAAEGLPPISGQGGTISTVGGEFSGSVASNYALNWIALPAGTTPYDVTMSNTSAGGQMRTTIACDTGTSLELTPLPVVVGGGGSTTLDSFDPSGCSQVVAVITNQQQTAADPSTSTQRSYTIDTDGEAPPPSTLTVSKAGTGSGTVTSTPVGVNCGSDCSHNYAAGTPVTLEANAAAGSVFVGWSGACSGTGDCNLTMDEDKAVTATFDDASAPSIPSLSSLPRFRPRSMIPLDWTGSNDPQSGIDHYTLEQQIAPPDQSFGPWQEVGTFTETLFEASGTPGDTYCFRVSATNGEGLTSDPSAPRCTSFPRDDRALTPSSLWELRNGTGHYLGTFVKSKRRGQTLTEDVTTKDLVLVATRCPDCGTVKVFIDDELLTQISLQNDVLRKRRVIDVATFASSRSGTVTIKIISRGKRVLIDGLGASPL